MDNFLESSPEEVLFILLTFVRGSKTQINLPSSDGNQLDPGTKVRKFLESKLSFWVKLLDDIVSTGSHSSNQVTEKEAAILWGCICCYPNLIDVHQNSCLLLKNLICSLDRLIETREGDLLDLYNSL
jgi:U3 small nucleolar RNA-associated protein 20